MKFETAKRAVDYYIMRSNAQPFRTIGYYGGEPLLQFDLIVQISDYVHRKWPEAKMNYHITTNGTLINPQIAKFLIDNNFSVSISLDGPQCIHDKNRVYKNGNGTFFRILENLAKIKKMNYNYYNSRISFLSLFEPTTDLSQVSAFFFDFLTDEFNFKNYKCGFAKDQDTDLYASCDKNHVKDQISKMWGKYSFFLQNGVNTAKSMLLEKALFDDFFYLIHNRNMSKIPSSCRPNGTCIPGKNRIFVTVSGDIYMCEKINYAFCLGNVFTGLDYSKIFNIMQEYCNISLPKCQKCWAIRFCDQCYLQCKKGTVLDNERKSANCDIYRDRTEWFIKMYCMQMEKNPNSFAFLDKVN